MRQEGRGDLSDGEEKEGETINGPGLPAAKGEIVQRKKKRASSKNEKGVTKAAPVATTRTERGKRRKKGSCFDWQPERERNGLPKTHQ